MNEGAAIFDPNDPSPGPSPPDPSPGPSPPAPTSSSTLWIVVGIIAGVILLILVAIFFVIRHKRRNENVLSPTVVTYVPLDESSRKVELNNSELSSVD